jgi:hypothetical protein
MLKQTDPEVENAKSVKQQLDYQESISNPLILKSIYPDFEEYIR